MWGCPLPPALIRPRPHFSKKILDNLRYSILDRFLWILTSILEGFLDPKSMFSKSSCCLILNFNLRSEVQKSWFYLGKMQFFTKLTFLLWSGNQWKTSKKQEKHHFEIKLFFHIDFSWILEPTWMDFGLQVGPQKTYHNCLFSKLRPRGVQEAPKRLQERPKGVSRASNSLPRGPQECPRAIKTCPGHAQGASRGSLFWGFPCFSMFFCVFLRFPAFFCVFLCFFCVFLQRTPVNFSTLSSKLNCVRQQAKASKSKQKQAKGSQSKQEPARV